MRDDRVYLQHIRDALDDVAAYCGSGHDAFIDDRMRQDATLRKLEVIGQVVKNPSEHTETMPCAATTSSKERLAKSRNISYRTGPR